MALQETLNGLKPTTKGVVATVGAITAILQVPAVQQAVGTVLKSHPTAGALLAGLVTILALIHNPQADQPPAGQPPTLPPGTIVMPSPGEIK